MAGLLDRLDENPAKAQMILYGLGLLGSKKRSQADRYIGGLGGALSESAKRKARAAEIAAQQNSPLVQAQIAQANAAAGLNTAKQGQIDAGGFGGTGASVQAMNKVAILAARHQAGEELTPTEMNVLRLSGSYLSRPQTITTADGRTIQLPGMDMSSYNIPGMSFATPVGPGDSELGRSDPLRTGDAAAVAEAQSTAKKYADMLPLFDAIEEDMQIYPTGQFADFELGARKIAAAVGFDESSVLAAGERLKKNFSKGISENMGFLKGAMSEGERAFTREFSLGMDTSVEGNNAYIGFLREVAKRAAAEGAMKREYYRQNNNSLDGWGQHWQDYIEANPVEIPKIGKVDDTIPEGAPPRAPGAGIGQTIWVDEDGNIKMDAEGNPIFY